ncbi:hypothetical protein BCU84_07075 [Shewanella sp. 10N.286.51.B7]|uniref:Uncharacterized protein n=1 Tax=Shewanella electrodiphila TaxID=934143 RepID=A0ABT0KU23_9GAMM|nr:MULTISPECIES: hypothetical protein [Shewanella]MCL1047335.1 hypothetical protein [Shewanella electrodiphila]PMG78640.1 hypothetical protein BCU84_07075 [Shewanella sp. 10N.286.51.B7]
MTYSKGYLCLIICAFFSSATQASDLSTLTKAKTQTGTQTKTSSTPPKPIPMGMVLDHQGQPISLPPEQGSLNFSSTDMLRDESIAPYNKPQITGKPEPTKLSASSGKTANDPSCRWLGNRIKQLSNQLKHHDQAAYLQTELSHRETEWQCMDCEGEGPSQGQQAECQYRR